MDETVTRLSAPGASAPPQDAETNDAASPNSARWASALHLAEAGLLTDVGLTLDLASIYLPLLGSAFIPLTPAPFAILYLRRGARVTLLAALVAGFLMTVLTGPHYGWRLSLQAVVGMAMGIAMRRQWRPIPAIALGTLVVTVVAYGAAFGAVFALGLPLHDLYSELANALHLGVQVLQITARLLGAQAIWAQIAPWIEQVIAFTLRYWIGMFALYVFALALPTVVLYYGVASSTAYALGHRVKPFPAPWFWRGLRVVGLALAPLYWLVVTFLRVVTAPLWGPFWVARWFVRRHQRARLQAELAAISAPTPDADTARDAPRDASVETAAP